MAAVWRWLLAEHPDADGRTLPLLIFRRAVRPYALAVSLATATLVMSTLTESGVGQRLDQGWGKAIGSAALLTVVLLWAGWWTQRKPLMDQGLLISTGVWSSVGALILLEGASWPSGLLAWAWAVASGGAWLLEVGDGRGKR